MSFRSDNALSSFVSFLPVISIVSHAFNGERSSCFHPHNEAVVVPAAEELAPNAVIQLKEMVAINCNNTPGLGRLIVHFTRERRRLSGEIKQPGGKKNTILLKDTVLHPLPQIFILQVKQ